MFKRIEKKASQLPSAMFITDNIYNDRQLTEYRGCKYFILFHNTYNVIAGATTQKALEYHIDEILKNGYNSAGRIYK
jgi:hypothetical protein